MHSLHDRLDEETGKSWELQRDTETPTAAAMLKFLDRQAAASSHQYDNRRAREQDTSLSVHNRLDNRARKPASNRDQSRDSNRDSSNNRPAMATGGHETAKKAVPVQHLPTGSRIVQVPRIFKFKSAVATRLR